MPSTRKSKKEEGTGANLADNHAEVETGGSNLATSSNSEKFELKRSKKRKSSEVLNQNQNARRSRSVAVNEQGSDREEGEFSDNEDEIPSKKDRKRGNKREATQPASARVAFEEDGEELVMSVQGPDYDSEIDGDENPSQVESSSDEEAETEI